MEIQVGSYDYRMMLTGKTSGYIVLYPEKVAPANVINAVTLDTMNG